MKEIKSTFSVNVWQGRDSEMRYYVNDWDYEKANLYISHSSNSRHKYSIDLENGYYAHFNKVYGGAVKKFIAENLDAIMAEILK